MRTQFCQGLFWRIVSLASLSSWGETASSSSLKATATPSMLSNVKWFIVQGFSQAHEVCLCGCKCVLRQLLMNLSNSSLNNALPQSRMKESQQKHPEGAQSSSRLSSLLHVLCCLSVSAFWVTPDHWPYVLWKTNKQKTLNKKCNCFFFFFFFLQQNLLLWLSRKL